MFTELLSFHFIIYTEQTAQLVGSGKKSCTIIYVVTILQYRTVLSFSNRHFRNLDGIRIHNEGVTRTHRGSAAIWHHNSFSRQRSSYRCPSSHCNPWEPHNQQQCMITMTWVTYFLWQWQPFWDGFETAKHINPTISAVQKLNYWSLLCDEASQAIAGFLLTCESYEHLLALLKDCYGSQY